MPRRNSAAPQVAARPPPAGTTGRRDLRYRGRARASVSLPGGSLPAEVYQPRDLAAQVFSVDDEVDEAVVPEEFAALEAFGELDLDGVPNRARSGEADEGLGLGDDEVAEHRERRGDPAR